MNRRPGNNRRTISYGEGLRRYHEFIRLGEDPVRKLNRPEKLPYTRPANGQQCPVCDHRMRFIEEAKSYGTHDEPDAATVEHKLPRSIGGKNEPANLIPMCNACNHARGDVLSEVLKLSKKENEQVEVEEVLHWLFLQLTSPYEAAVKYAHHQKYFQEKWEYYHRDKEKFSPAKPLIGGRPGNMSANARQKRRWYAQYCEYCRKLEIG